MKKITSILLTLLLLTGALAACTQTSEELSIPTETPQSEETTEPETVSFPDPIPINRPFEPIPGNVVMLSCTFQNTLIFTEDAIWKMSDSWTFSEEHNGDVWQLTEPARMMDGVVATDNIERVIENTHILTTDQTLYFLDFEHGEVVRQLEDVTSIYHWHVGTLYNPLRYVRTADGSAWRVDTAEVQRLPDDVELFDGMPRGDTIPDALLDKWFDDVREVASEFVLTEDNILWMFRHWWEDDAEPTVVREDVRSLMGGILTTDNVLWTLPWDSDESHFVMEHVRFSDGALAITLDNELWSVAHWWKDGKPFFIMEDVMSVQDRFGFITTDDTLWWLPGWGIVVQEYQPPVRVMENVLRTWWNWSGSEFITTRDGSLWLFNYEDYTLVQIFQAEDIPGVIWGNFMFQDIAIFRLLSEPFVQILGPPVDEQGDLFFYEGWEIVAEGGIPNMALQVTAFAPNLDLFTLNGMPMDMTRGGIAALLGTPYYTADDAYHYRVGFSMGLVFYFEDSDESPVSAIRFFRIIDHEQEARAKVLALQIAGTWQNGLGERITISATIPRNERWEFIRETANGAYEIHIRVDGAGSTNDIWFFPVGVEMLRCGTSDTIVPSDTSRERLFLGRFSLTSCCPDEKIYQEAFYAK